MLMKSIYHIIRKDIRIFNSLESPKTINDTLKEHMQKGILRFGLNKKGMKTPITSNNIQL